MAEEGKTGEEGKTEEGENKDDITLNAETYNALLTKLDDLEEQIKEGGQEQETDAERLAREAKEKTETGSTETVDYDKLTNVELVTTIDEQIRNNVLGPLTQQIAALSLQLEIDRLKSEKDEEGKAVYADFDKFKTKIYEIGTRNPNLSLKEMYNLAKGKKEPSEKEEGKSERDKLLMHLPTPKVVHGEKPGAASSSTTKGDPKDLKGAAARAFDETFKGGIKE